MMQSEPEDMTFLDIVWGQFKKNRMAYAAMWLVVVLFLLAVYAPVIASERPFIWQDSEGTCFPWFSSLFDHNYYENGVDKFFNLLLILGTPVFVVLVVLSAFDAEVWTGKETTSAEDSAFSSVMVIGFLVVFLGVILTQSGSRIAITSIPMRRQKPRAKR